MQFMADHALEVEHAPAIAVAAVGMQLVVAFIKIDDAAEIDDVRGLPARVRRDFLHIAVPQQRTWSIGTT
jgi:hypothetical protein